MGKFDAQEELAKQGLDIAHYPFKWKQALALVESNQRRDGRELLPYWERVRLLYLELGGEFIDRHRE